MFAGQELILKGVPMTKEKKFCKIDHRRKRKSPSKHEGSSKKKRTYDKARIAFEALALLAQGNPTSPSSSSNCTEDSNQAPKTAKPSKKIIQKKRLSYCLVLDFSMKNMD